MASDSTFNFDDQYGSDPITRRYDVKYGELSAAQAATRASAAGRQLAEAKLATAQAELDAQLAPLKAVNDAFTTMSGTMAEKTKLERSMKVRRDATAINEGLGAVENLDGLIQLQNSNAAGMEDEDAKTSLENKALNFYVRDLDTAQNLNDVNRIATKLPPSYASNPAFDRAYQAAVLQNKRREDFYRSAAEAGIPIEERQKFGSDVLAGEQLVAEQTGTEKRKEAKRADIRLIMSRIGDLQKEGKAQMEQDLLTEMPTDIALEIQSLQGQYDSYMKEAFPTQVTPAPTTKASSGDTFQPVGSGNAVYIPTEPATATDSTGETKPVSSYFSGAMVGTKKPSE